MDIVYEHFILVKTYIDIILSIFYAILDYFGIHSIDLKIICSAFFVN